MTNPELISKAVRPYRRRLGLHAAVRAFLAALTAGGFVFAAVTLAYKIAQADIGVTAWIGSGGAALVTLTAAFWILLPNQAETARRIDALGLKDRTSAMLALRNSPYEIASLQREDALRHLETVSPGRLKGKIGAASVALLLLALLTAAASVLVPASWFARETDEMSGVWEDVLDMLREERDRMEASGEGRLAEELDRLIDEMENTDSVLRALGEISGTEESVKDAAREGEASRGAMNEALDVLEEARRMLLGEEEEEAGEESEEGMEGGEMMLVPGDGEEGMEGEGEFPGEGPGERPGEMPGGEDGMGQGSGEGEGEGIPSNMTEPVYDPISGAVPYGKVFSAYYSDYLRDAENGEIPYEAEDAARAYFEDLDR